MANSLSQFYKTPANFLYIYATDSFISKLGKPATIIRAKKANQKKLLNTTAVDEGKTYTEAYNKIAEAFKSFYGMSPQKALITLASGGEVAGKNWSKGIYGIGSPKKTQTYFENTPGSSALIAVDPNTGIMYDMDDSANAGGKYVESLGVSAYAYDANGKAQYRYIDANGNTYTSTYNKRTGKYEASQYAQKGGNTFNANGTQSTPADMASVWESLTLSLGKLVAWLLSLFNKENGTNKQTITAANTQPTQADGWISNAGVSPWVLIAVAAGTVVASGGLGSFWKSAQKSKK